MHEERDTLWHFVTSFVKYCESQYWTCMQFRPNFRTCSYGVGEGEKLKGNVSWIWSLSQTIFQPIIVRRPTPKTKDATCTNRQNMSSSSHLRGVEKCFAISMGSNEPPTPLKTKLTVPLKQKGSFLHMNTVNSPEIGCTVISLFSPKCIWPL